MVPVRIHAWLQWLEGMSLGVRLAVLVTVPLLVIALSATLALHDRWSSASESATFSAGLGDVALIQEAVHRLQVERELAVRLRLESATAAQSSQRSELASARARTDRAIEAAGLGATIPEDVVAQARPPGLAPRERRDGPGPGQEGGQATSRTARDDRPPGPRPEPNTLAALRAALDGSDREFWRLLSSYSLLVADFEEQSLEAARLRAGSQLSSPLVTYLHLNAAVEALSEMRDLGVGYLDEPGSVDAAHLAVLSDQERSQLSQAALTAAPSQLAALEPLTVLGEDAVGGDNRALILGANRNVNPGTTALDLSPELAAGEWLARSAERRDTLVRISGAFLEDLISDAESSAAASYRQFVLILALTLLLLLVVTLGAWAVSRSISRPLHRLALTAQLAAVGHLTAVDVPPSRDAIGEIGEAIDELRTRSDAIARAAEEIAGGDLTTTIEPRSGADRLGWALRTMTQRLASMVAQSEQRSERLAGEVGSLQETASRDALTGLANRRRFSDVLESAIAIALDDGGRFGLLFIDLDGFKQVNDTMGHDVGDELLRRVADRLTEVSGPSDTVGRFGGDEFTVMVGPNGDPGDPHVQASARRVVATLTAPYEIGGRMVELGASLGVALFPDHGESAEQLLRSSDQAMYAAKQAGGGIRVAPVPEAAA